jgi:hypothetical protein
MRDKYYVYGVCTAIDYKIAVVESANIKNWLSNYNGIYNYLKLVKSDGVTIDVISEDGSSWGVVEESFDKTILNERATFKDFVKKRKTDKKVKRAIKDKPQDQRKHHMKISRGINRKDQNYIPKYRRLEHATSLSTAENVLKTAKDASSGAWKLSPLQVKEISDKYKFIIPDKVGSSKHLGSTGILMWRKSARDMYLVKFSKHHNMIKRKRKSRRR